MTLNAGDRIDRYVVEAPLGEGGAATVYRVRHAVLGSRHALKVLQAKWTEDEGQRNRFLAEGRILAQLRHPNLLSITDVVIVPGVAGLVADLMEGRSLAEALDTEGALPEEEALRVIRGVLAGIGRAHAAGIVHRDIKPENIILHEDADGSVRPVVLDFGIAKMSDSSVVEHRSRKMTQLAVGTPGYMAPEQITSPGSIDHRVDIFAIGVLLYELVTGEPPFGDDGTFQVERRIVDGDHGAMTRLGELSPHLRAAVLKALAVDPAGRFPDCEEFLAALGTKGVASPAGPVAVRSRRGALWGGVVAALVLGVVAVAFLGTNGARAPTGLVPQAPAEPPMLAVASPPAAEPVERPAVTPAEPPTRDPVPAVTPSAPSVTRPAGCTPEDDSPREHLTCVSPRLRKAMKHMEAAYVARMDETSSMSGRLVLREAHRSFEARLEACVGSLSIADLESAGSTPDLDVAVVQAYNCLLAELDARIRSLSGQTR